ncbi:MAG: iron-containing alcohol dehydrogenase [Eggerthellaceae bacterium]|nr:iron-containing alcohol dehydrogenase [Eggerthellaceae bacterium]
MENFIFENSTRFYFGKGQLETALERELAGARTVMVVYGGGSVKRTGLFDRIVAALPDKRIVEFGGIMANPTIAKVAEGAEVARSEGVDYILAVGGGSVMDACKVIALAATEGLDEDSFWDKYFVRFEPVAADASPIPLGNVVTAAGTGSEGNGGSVITNEKTLVKTGADRPQLNARFAVLEPELTFTVPETQTVAGGYDALNHMMEEYFSAPVGDNLADDLLEAAMRCIIRDLPRVVDNPEDYESRANLMWASSLAENRVLKSGKRTCFQCHMIEHQVGAYTDCVHGFGLAAITANYYRCIYDATPESLFQFRRFAVNVWGVDPEGKDDAEIARLGIEALDAWTREVGAHRTLAELGLEPEQVDEIAATVACLPTDFKRLTTDDVAAILRESM